MEYARQVFPSNSYRQFISLCELLDVLLSQKSLQIPMFDVRDPFEHESTRKMNIRALFEKLCRNLTHLVLWYKVYLSFPVSEHNGICSSSVFKQELELLKWLSRADLTVECCHKPWLQNVLFRQFISFCKLLDVLLSQQVYWYPCLM